MRHKKTVTLTITYTVCIKDIQQDNCGEKDAVEEHSK